MGFIGSNNETIVLSSIHIDVYEETSVDEIWIMKFVLLYHEEKKEKFDD
jgi:hypothetical protein